MKVLYDQRAGDGRATTDISDTARAATFGAVETLLVDIDTVVHGTVDEKTGASVRQKGRRENVRHR